MEREGYRENQAIAIWRYARISPLKARQVLRLIHGKDVETALYTLKALHKKAARMAEKLLFSALANAENKGLRVEKLYVKKAVADRGPMYKRWIPRAYGRATPIRRRTSHLTIILEEKND